MRNDYTDYIAHSNFHKYVAKVKTASGNKYFYTQDEYNSYLRGGRTSAPSGPARFFPTSQDAPVKTKNGKRYKKVEGAVNGVKSILSSARDAKNKAANRAVNGRMAGIHQTPTRGLSGAAYTVKNKAAAAASTVRGTVGSAKNRAINGRMAGIHQTPTRGLSGAAYTAKRGITAAGDAAKKKMVGAAATVGSTKVTNAKNGPQAPASVYGKHKVNNAKNAVKNAAISVRDKTIGAPDSNSAYRVGMRKAKNFAGKAADEVRKTFVGDHNHMSRISKAKMNVENKISSLEYNASKKIKGLLAKGKSISPALAEKMSNSVQKLKSKVHQSGASSEEIKMMNDKLDRIMKQIEQNQEKPLKNTGSHPAYNQDGSHYTNNQGIAGVRGNRAMQGSRPTDNQGYVSKKDRKKAAKAARRK